MENNKSYTLEQLVELANTGACAVATEKANDKVCAEPTTAAFMNPSKLKFKGSCERVFRVQNQTAGILHFALGTIGRAPGLGPIYANSEIFGLVGVDSASFFVGDSVTPVATSPNALALQRIQAICGRGIVSRIAVVREPVASAILSSDIIIERFICTNGKCTADRQPPICGMCPGDNDVTTSLVWDLGLVGFDERNGIYLPIPGGGAEAPIHEIRVTIAFNEQAYGYGATC